MSAKNDLVVKMGLQTNEFATDLKGAQEQIKSLQQSIKNAEGFVQNLGGKMLSAAKSFAGWAGAGLAAKEGLEKFLRAGQTTSDWLDRNMASWSGLFDEFFRSLNNGTVTGFLSNMGAVKKAIQEATIAADAFADAKASMNVLSIAYDVKQRQLLEELKRNKNNPEIVKRVQGKLRQLEEDRKNTLSGVVGQKQTSFETLLNSTMIQPMAAGLRQLGDFSLKRIMELKPTTLSEFGKLMEAEALGTFESALSEAKKIAESTVGTRQTYQYDIHGNRILGYEKYDKKVLSDKEISSFSERWGFSIADIIYYSELVDKTRDALRNSASELYALQKSQFEFNERNTEVFNMGASGGGGSSAVSYAEGSLGWYDKQIAEKKKELLAVTDSAIINDISRVIEQLEYARKRLLFESRNTAPNAGALGFAIAPLQGGVTPIDKSSLMMPTTPSALQEMATINPYEGAISGLSAVADMMSTINGLTNDGTQAWLNYASNVITAMRSLMTALQAVGIGQATANAASAGPFGWMQIPIAIASVIAAFASAPKFAYGGIVGGSSYSGDKVLARVNSGEMILNHAQQANLWHKLNGASAGAVGQVEFKIKGSELVGVINNYSSRRAHIL